MNCFMKIAWRVLWLANKVCWFSTLLKKLKNFYKSNPLAADWSRLGLRGRCHVTKILFVCNYVEYLPQNQMSEKHFSNRLKDLSINLGTIFYLVVNLLLVAVTLMQPLWDRPREFSGVHPETVWIHAKDPSAMTASVSRICSCAAFTRLSCYRSVPWWSYYR